MTTLLPNPNTRTLKLIVPLVLALGAAACDAVDSGGGERGGSSNAAASAGGTIDMSYSQITGLSDGATVGACQYENLPRTPEMNRIVGQSNWSDHGTYGGYAVSSRSCVGINGSCCAQDGRDLVCDSREGYVGAPFGLMFDGDDGRFAIFPTGEAILTATRRGVACEEVFHELPF